MKRFVDIAAQIEIQLTQRELEEKFADGKPHTLTMMNAVFVDGYSMPQDAFAPLVLQKVIHSKDEFNEQFGWMMGLWMKPQKDAVYESLMVQRAAGLAAINFFTEMHQMHASGGEPTEAMRKATHIIGCAMGTASEGAWEDALGLDSELLAEFSAYLETTPLPGPISLDEKREPE